MVFTLVIHACNYIADTLITCNYMGYYSFTDPEGMEG